MFTSRHRLAVACASDRYPTCLKLIAEKRIDVKPLITHRFSCSPADVAKGAWRGRCVHTVMGC